MSDLKSAGMATAAQNADAQDLSLMRGQRQLAGAMATNPSLGTLSAFPREIRVKIYEAVLFAGNTSFWLHQSFSEESVLLNMLWQGLDRGILHTSSQTRHEALSILFTHGIFDFSFSLWPNELGFEDLLWGERMMNVNFGFDEEWHQPAYDLGNQNPEITFKPTEPLSFFAGNRIHRNTCNITIFACTREFVRLISSPLHHAIADLIGFKIVHLTFRSMWSARRGPNGFDKDSDFRNMIIRFATALEPSLGLELLER